MQHEKKLRELLYSLMKWRLRGVDLTASLSIWWKSIQQMELDPSWRCAVIGWETMDTSCNQILCVPCVRETDRERCSKFEWTQCWAFCSNWPCSQEESGLDDLSRSILQQLFFDFQTNNTSKYFFLNFSKLEELSTVSRLLGKLMGWEHKNTCHCMP